MRYTALVVIPKEKETEMEHGKYFFQDMLRRGMDHGAAIVLSELEAMEKESHVETIWMAVSHALKAVAETMTEKNQSFFYDMLSMAHAKLNGRLDVYFWLDRFAQANANRCANDTDGVKRLFLQCFSFLRGKPIHVESSIASVSALTEEMTLMRHAVIGERRLRCMARIGVWMKSLDVSNFNAVFTQWFLTSSVFAPLYKAQGLMRAMKMAYGNSMDLRLHLNFPVEKHAGKKARVLGRCGDVAIVDVDGQWHSMARRDCIVLAKPVEPEEDIESMLLRQLL
jgi:hypothetical protein